MGTYPTGYVWSSDARAWTAHYADCTFSTLTGDRDRTLGPFRTARAARDAGKAATGAYPGDHAGFSIRYEELKDKPRDQAQIVSDTEMDYRAARDGYNPN